MKSDPCFDGQQQDTVVSSLGNIRTLHTEAPRVSPSVPLVKLTVNGLLHEVQVEPNWTLWEILRDKLGFTSPKDMCGGYGACSSCTVIMNGRPILSCMTLAIDCDGATIETAEGIADAQHPLIDAYVNNWALQCGYCTPGFITTAKALLDRNPKPTADDIRDALGGNICKCSSYPAHIPAILEAAKELEAKPEQDSVQPIVTVKPHPSPRNKIINWG